MNFIVRLKNNLEYAHWRKMSDVCFAKMKEHDCDEDITEWRKWAIKNLECLKKCMEIPLH